MILQTEYMKYDRDEHFYYLTEAGLIKYTGYDYVIDMWKPSASAMLIKMGRALQDFYTDSFHNNKPKYYKHRDLINYKVYKNEYGERIAIRKALSLMVELQEDNDWFTMYLAGEAYFPKSIKKILENVNVYVVGEMSGSIDESVYEVDY